MRSSSFVLVLGSLVGTASGVSAQGQFQLAPAVALEAENFHIDNGWQIVKNGTGNYMVDIIGFNHISGERLLCVDSKTERAVAHREVSIPEAGPYRLWVRYEYPPFTEARFRVRIEQAGKTIVQREMGAKANARYAFGDTVAKPQYDPPWGAEGLVLEAVDVPALQKGKAKITLAAVKQPQTPGIAAGRHIDLLYLTRDLKDGWRTHYRKRVRLYPILEAFRDTRGARYEVRFTNKSEKSANFGIRHTYNRIPWGATEGLVARDVAPGKTSDWVPLRLQDTTHFGMSSFTSSGGKMHIDVRSVGGKEMFPLTGESPLRVYLPPYPGKGEKPITPTDELDAVLAKLKQTPTIGKKPTLPLCYGGWMPVGVPDAYGKKYAELYTALGFRSLHSALSGPDVMKNLEAVGLKPTKSWAVSGYRNPPLPANIEKAKSALMRNQMKQYLRFYDYGDEIGFSEWLNMLVKQFQAKAAAQKTKITPQQVLSGLWVEWLRRNRPKSKPSDYWLDAWGRLDLTRLRPDSTASTAKINPRLYVDSLQFYEETAIAFVASGAKLVKQEFGEDVLCGANYSAHPFYYPTTTMYIKWFRGGAADMGRHSEYFWQVTQAGPMINGYLAEHFRAGMRNNPKAVLRQYTMPHIPGNTDASFLRSSFSHLAHGAKMLDFFGIGMNECFTENHIDHRAHHRYLAMRDVTHAVGLVEDLLPQSQAVASPVAMLVSESTERWDFAGIATDRAGHAHFGPDFRKTRLLYHLERFGLWQALTFQGVSPDLLIEEDLTAEMLKDYRVLVLVGDCLPPEKAEVLENWVQQGGTLLATASAGRFDPYKKPIDVYRTLFGLQKRTTEMRTTFLRPRQELPFEKPLGEVQTSNWKMPALAIHERIEPSPDVSIDARFTADNTPVVVRRLFGKGRVIYLAAMPGLASLWSALQPPLVPDRGPNTHSVPTNFDAGTRALLQSVLRQASVEPIVETEPELIDARLLRAPGGYVLPLANYEGSVGQKVTLRVRVPSAIEKVTSAYLGELSFTKEGDVVVIGLSKLGYGDVLRLE